MNIKEAQDSAELTSEAGERASLCVITYTTLYREGGAELTLAAQTKAAELEALGERVLKQVVESKGAFIELFKGLKRQGEQVKSLYFFGHAGMYGPMFKTTSHPEQLSPHEWRELALELPFSPEAEAHFHACRTARWFAPFFARTFKVPCSGFHEYTSFSAHPTRFKWPGLKPKAPLYLMGCRGKKSGGLSASLQKYLGGPLEEPKRFNPHELGDEASYARVAGLYDEVFEDIRVRRDEWAWLCRAFERAARGASAQNSGDQGLKVLDIGCGNGALLKALAEEGYLSEGLGVDSSPQMIERAQARREGSPAPLRFEVIEGPQLPAADQSLDLIVSLLSWRYLDWDPLLSEIMRTLKPGGRLLVVDMVTAPPRLAELPRLLKDSLRARAQRWSAPRYQAALRRLSADPAWAEMLRYNPIRAQHELVWYFESRFPGRRVELINIGRRARILAFDSGPISDSHEATPMSYP